MTYLTAVAAAAGGNRPAEESVKNPKGVTKGLALTVENVAEEIRLLGVGRVGRPPFSALRERIVGHDRCGMVLYSEEQMRSE